MTEDNESLDPIVAELIKARKALKLRQEDVAAAAGISRRALVMIEAGGDCSLSTLRSLCDTLSIELKAQFARPTLEDLQKIAEQEFSANQSTERPRG